MSDPVGSARLSARTIFAVGVSQRTGTNFLGSILLLHPDCAALEPPIVNTEYGFESHLLEHADLLDDYIARTSAMWGKPHDTDALLRASFRADVGDSLLRGLLGGAHERILEVPRLVTRFPSTRNLHLLTGLFPGARAVVVVRDPRAVAMSGVKTFGAAVGRDYGESAWEGWVRVWADGVRAFLAASASSASAIQGVRYEDLVTRPEETVRRILAFLDLDPARYPFEELNALPVVGSSKVIDDQGYVHWDPSRGVDAPATLDDDDWPERRLARLQLLAGEEMAALGYGLPEIDRVNEVAARWVDGSRRVGRGAANLVRSRLKRPR